MTLNIGAYNDLTVLRLGENGAFLEAGEYGSILLPKRYVPVGCEIDDVVSVFVYLDSEDRLVATTTTPKAQVGDLVALRVVDTNSMGAFLDWGLPKDLMVPFREQPSRMQTGRSYLVKVLLDNSNRIIASSRLNRFISDDGSALKEKQTVDIIVANKTEMGFKAVVNGEYWGLLYGNEVFRPLRTGDKAQATIKKVRADGRLDLRLIDELAKNRNDLGDLILIQLKKHDGFLPLSDGSSPAEIKKAFGVSKRVFKQAIGGLFKKELIMIEKNGIRLL